jgi:hypothetical protein
VIGPSGIGSVMERVEAFTLEKRRGRWVIVSVVNP